MTYAPVIIPTLNRFEHFKNCLESLEQCTGADKTNVFVGLDFPPSEKYKEGWIKIDAYLQKKEKQNLFNQLIIIRRDHNYGMQGNGNNFECLQEEVFKKYDRLIFTEDDNVFSPNFLDYINKGLEKFKDDKRIFAINGYKYPLYKIKTNKNSFFCQNVHFSAWGYGIWKDRYQQAILYTTSKKFLEKLNFKTFFKLLKNGNYRTLQFFNFAGCKSRFPLTDSVLSVYMAINDMDVIMPLKSLVRNNGWDGSGLHCQNKQFAKIYKGQEIQKQTRFEYTGTGFEFYKFNKKILRTKTTAQTKLIGLFGGILKFFIKTHFR